jgi:hypothetical protein
MAGFVPLADFGAINYYTSKNKNNYYVVLHNGRAKVLGYFERTTVSDTAIFRRSMKKESYDIARIARMETYGYVVKPGKRPKTQAGWDALKAEILADLGVDEEVSSGDSPAWSDTSSPGSQGSPGSPLTPNGQSSRMRAQIKRQAAAATARAATPPGTPGKKAKGGNKSKKMRTSKKRTIYGGYWF